MRDSEQASSQESDHLKPSWATKNGWCQSKEDPDKSWKIQESSVPVSVNSAITLAIANMPIDQATVCRPER
ncbi:MAG: hypothetical protein R2848_10330 [Thermomicrobiales bacterium]